VYTAGTEGNSSCLWRWIKFTAGEPIATTAFQLGTSERTIKAHRHMVMHKLNVQSFAEAVSIAERLGLLSQPAPVDMKDQG
jgi:hypothetical protein